MTRIIESIIDKESEKEVLGGLGNLLVTIEGEGDSEGKFIKGGDTITKPLGRVWEIISEPLMEVSEEGPVRTKIRVRKEFKSIKLHPRNHLFLGEGAMSCPKFTKKVVGELINPNNINTFSSVGDINNDGLLDIVISGRNGRMVWFENGGTTEGWQEHYIDEAENIECGGSLFDVNADGYLDIINGNDASADSIYWWENPGREDGKWERRLIAKTGNRQFHDTVIGDVTNDGVMSLVFTNQLSPGGTFIYRVAIAQDPYVSPWPGLEVIANGKVEVNPYRKEGVQPEEGLAIGDVDGDGKNELVCGTHWYKYVNGTWEAHKFASGYICTKVAIGDIDSDGINEILLSEGDPCIYGKSMGGKLAWFKPGDDITAIWEEHILEDFLLDAHSLQVGNICGNGNIDIFVGEVGVASKRLTNPPRMIVFENDGKGNFKRHVIDEGTGIHDGLLADMLNRGVLDIVGKPLHGPDMYKVFVWFNEVIR